MRDRKPPGPPHSGHSQNGKLTGATAAPLADVLATGMALLAWYIFAPQCLSTLAAIHRESGGWKLPAITLLYQLALAYVAAFITFQGVSAWV